LFDQNIGNVDLLDKLSNENDANATTEEKARSYLSVNCSHCHHPNPGARCNTGTDFRYNSFVGNLVVLLDVMNPRIVAGNAAASPISQRMNAVDGTRMPFYGSKIVDPGGTTLIDTWINGL